MSLQFLSGLRCVSMYHMAFSLYLANIYYPVLIATFEMGRWTCEETELKDGIGTMRINNDRMHPKIRKEREKLNKWMSFRFSKQTKINRKERVTDGCAESTFPFSVHNKMNCSIEMVSSFAIVIIVCSFIRSLNRHW